MSIGAFAGTIARQCITSRAMHQERVAAITMKEDELPDLAFKYFLCRTKTMKALLLCPQETTKVPVNIFYEMFWARA